MSNAAQKAGSDVQRLVRVDLADRSYDIEIGPGLISACGASIKPYCKSGSCVVVTDETVASHYLNDCLASLKTAGLKARSIVLPPGEATKSYSQLETLLDNLLDGGVERSTVLIALGGGVIGDLVGFAASITLRGLPFIQIPTTLLSQVDSSVGGKTAINARAGKNLIGTFYQPKLVLADTDTLHTLPRRELQAGYAEVVKYGALGDSEFFNWLEANGAALLDGDAAARAYAIEKCCRMKADIVARDEFEGGVRALLNLGHTFGHALESRCGYGPDLLHGEGVAIGMVMAFDLSVRLGLCSGQDSVRVKRHFDSVGMRTRPGQIGGYDWQTDDLVGRMASDKKVQNGKLTFIVVRGIGDAFVTQDVPLDILRDTVMAALDEPDE